MIVGDKMTKYTEQDKLDIIGKKITNGQFAKKYDTTVVNIIQLRHKWRVERNIKISRTNAVYKHNNAKPSKGYNIVPFPESNNEI